MPGLIACSRRWNIGSDDLFLPAIVEFGLHSLWLIAVASLFWSHEKHQECPGANLLHTYLIGLQIWLALIIVLNSAIIFVSTKGTIVQTRPRKHMPKLLYARTFLALVEIGWNVVGTMWAFRSAEAYCESYSLILLVQIAAVSGWFLLAFLAFGVWMVFDPLGSRKEKDASKAELKANKVWEKRFKILCCCTHFNRESRSAYSEVAVLFSSYFQDVDFVPSDVAAALILLQEKLLRSNNNRSLQPPNFHFENSKPLIPNVIITEEPNSEDINNSSTTEDASRLDWMTAANANHFNKYAFGIYGWPMYLYYHFGTAVCKLWREVKCCACCRPDNQVPYLEGDNCCLCNFTALKQTADIQSEEDLLYVSFHNEVYEVPFYVALDHKTRSVVVAIRGTLSLKDALTDLTADVEPLCEDGCPTSSSCHRGMMRAALFVKNKLTENGTLVQAFQKCPDYGLVITGHSLGAGVATLFATTMKSAYPDLKCFAFSPPAGLLSAEAAAYSKSFVMSVIFGDDFICRLSIHSMEELKRNLVQCLVECNQPKYKVFAHGCWSVITGKPHSLSISGNSSHDASPAGSQNIRPLLNNLTVQETSNTNAMHQTAVDLNICPNISKLLETRPKFYVPGRILYIRQTSTGFKAMWASPECFNQMIISTSMAIDHMPDRVQYALSQITDANII